MAILLRHNGLEQQITAYAVKRGGISLNRAIAELVQIGLENTKMAAMDLFQIEGVILAQFEDLIAPAIESIKKDVTNASIQACAASLLNAQLIADISDDPTDALDLWAKAQAKAAQMTAGIEDIKQDADARLAYDSNMDKGGAVHD